jgi:hypothetical protein
MGALYFGADGLETSMYSSSNVVKTTAHAQITIPSFTICLWATARITTKPQAVALTAHKGQ